MEDVVFDGGLESLLAGSAEEAMELSSPVGCIHLSLVKTLFVSFYSSN